MQPRRPEQVSPLTSQVLDVLQRSTMFPWPLLKTQADRHGIDGASLDAASLRAILDDLVKGLERFASPEKAAVARSALEALLQATLPRRPPEKRKPRQLARFSSVPRRWVDYFAIEASSLP